jgi:hypothetical protein
VALGTGDASAEGKARLVADAILGIVEFPVASERR